MTASEHDGRSTVDTSGDGAVLTAIPATSDASGSRVAKTVATGPRTSPAGHIGQLTGIRAVAALWVLTFHFRPELLKAFGFLYPLVPVFNVGYLGVDLFFVLSGFILTYTHLDRMTEGWGPKKIAGFLWLRLSRIWPVLFFMLLVWGAYLAFSLETNNDGRLQAALNPARFLAHVFLVHAWDTTHHDWNPVDWSLSAEWLAYLVFAVLVVLLARMLAHLGSRALVLVAAVLAVPIVVVGLGFQDGADLLWNDDKIVAGIVPLRVLTEFFAGAVVALLVKRHGSAVQLPWFLKPTAILVAIVAALYVVQLWDPARRLRFGQDWRINGHLMWGSTETIVVVPLFLLLIGSLAVSGRDPATRLLSGRVLVWGGKISFALYMGHWLFLDLMRKTISTKLALPDEPAGWQSWPYRLTVLVAIGLAVLGAHLVYRFVEEPCRRAMRALLPASMRV
ncbi:acyltransferase family protein [Amycolatopsis australiensis]|uniref:Peptidoglycan/LPS O-acetylase OafA/YrhL, contains acyltransferase and SGNH-hydrolase domains n=1 Tax=Amycolatopsis australiensis TaxID=546364 RepID=A0A1K1P4J1_9PSEU|nr:acyltransferase [Amycolatopsis australiensis]SFW42417.1 Peptidoglycan/LPS O-acetylase OafA/YrhL, contains acyltransferase and SGNH-hydrolase domains [Amycolatopsis australiensis]